MSGRLSDSDTPDPWMIKFKDKYLLTFTTGSNVVLWSSTLLHDFHETAPAKEERILWY
jgi:hypothetical protein